MRTLPKLQITKMFRPRRALIIFAFLAALLTVSAACNGGDDPDPSGSPNGSTGATEPPNGSDVSPTETPEDLGEVLALVSTFLDGVDGKIVYDYTSNVGQHADATYTTYYLGDLERHDWLNRAGGFEVTVVTLVTEDTGYICTLVPDFPTCQETPPDRVRASRPVYEIIPINLRALSQGAADMTAVQLANEEIAGTTGVCYEIDIAGRLIQGPPGSEQMKLCFTDDGGLLLMDHDLFFDDPAVPQGELDFIALEVSEAAAADFEPPAMIIGS